MEIENKEIKETWSEKSFFQQIKEIWQNLKNYISESFSAKQNDESELNGLKQDVKTDETDKSSEKEKTENNEKENEKEDEKKNEKTENNENAKSKESKSEKVSDSVEKDKKLFQKLKEICVRSKKYWDVNKNDCGFVSIWLLQFHGDKTGKILNNIKSVDPNRFNSIMTDPLFKNIEKASSSKRNDTQANQYKKLMEDPKAQKEMDKAVDETIEWYLEKVKSWWVTNEKAILAFWRICNYGSWYAQQISKKMAQGGADINDYKQVIEWFEKSEKSQGKTTTSQKFKKKYSCFWNKSIEEEIWEYNP